MKEWDSAIQWVSQAKLHSAMFCRRPDVMLEHTIIPEITEELTYFRITVAHSKQAFPQGRNFRTSFLPFVIEKQVAGKKKSIKFKIMACKGRTWNVFSYEMTVLHKKERQIIYRPSSGAPGKQTPYCTCILLHVLN